MAVEPPFAPYQSLPAVVFELACTKISPDATAPTPSPPSSPNAITKRLYVKLRKARSDGGERMDVRKALGD